MKRLFTVFALLAMFAFAAAAQMQTQAQIELPPAHAVHVDFNQFRPIVANVVTPVPGIELKLDRTGKWLVITNFKICISPVDMGAYVYLTVNDQWKPGYAKADIENLPAQNHFQWLPVARSIVTVIQANEGDVLRTEMSSVRLPTQVGRGNDSYVPADSATSLTAILLDQ